MLLFHITQYTLKTCSTFYQMFLDPVDNDTKHNKTLKQTAGLDVGVLIREVRIYETWFAFIIFTYLRYVLLILISSTYSFIICIRLNPDRLRMVVNDSKVVQI